MPSKQIDDKLLLAGLETKWDSSDRLVVPSLSIPNSGMYDRPPLSPCPSYTSRASPTMSSPSSNEWKYNKPLPPVPHPQEKHFPSLHQAGSSVGESLPAYTPRPLTPRPMTPGSMSSRPTTPQPPMAPRPLTPRPVTPQPLQTRSMTPQPSLTRPMTQQPLNIRPMTPQPVKAQPMTPQASVSRPVAPKAMNPWAMMPRPQDQRSLNPEFSLAAAAALEAFPNEASWPQPVEAQPATGLYPPYNAEKGLFPPYSPNATASTQSRHDGPSKQPSKKSSEQRLFAKDTGEGKPIWRTLKAGVRRVITTKASSSGSKKSKSQIDRRASIILRMSSTPTQQQESGYQQQDWMQVAEKEDAERYQDAVSRMKNVLASLLEDGYSMDLILQAEANQKFLQSLFLRVQNDPLLGLDIAPPAPPTLPPLPHLNTHTYSHSVPPPSPAPTAPLPPLPFSSAHPAPTPSSPATTFKIRKTGIEDEDAWSYVGYEDDATMQDDGPSIHFFNLADDNSDTSSTFPRYTKMMAEIEDNLTKAFRPTRWSLTKPGLEDMTLQILLQLDELDDLFAFAQVNRATYQVFKRHELPLMQNTIRLQSPAAWEHRQISDVNSPESSEEEAFTAAVYYRHYIRDQRTLVTLKGLMMTHCRAVMRSASYTALSRPSSPAARKIDNAIWRVWTFCHLFGMQTGRDHDLDGQVSWLRGEVRSPFQPCPDPSDVCSVLFDPPPGFGEGNPGGLSVTDMQDMDEVWTCLKYVFGFLRGETERARRFGVFSNASNGHDTASAPNTEKRNQGMIMLHEWVWYLLTLGPEAVVELAPLGPDTHAETTFQRAMSRGWTRWSAPRAGATRSAFLTDALGRVSGGLRRLEELQRELWFNYL
ncbi:uncharacterized protein BP01DRAFT_289406 [Aspergillus saccharolyticus JOP 1030-1]|uniref:Uncharacterized protein n=1 Tax=Aspergillus saccharolyticus JOP 1030-1 TaxID=1450539 RepID=A0A319A9E9_9EURO|nr:hypothetical protein BP01DRAFT_289406 [Aspergillus saccharolyticus JOP 1030-1]PYH48328.1 hypothetical protein BP01DRAFT_289406 [Aspergillus saccharolyticus JOP 1030-1]